MSYTPELGHAGSLAKFNRAIRLIRTIDRLVGGFVRRPPCSIDFRHDPVACEIAGTLTVLEEPPPLISAIVGEVLYDLRSTLDHFVYALTVKESGEALQGTEFPIFRDEPAYLSAARGGGHYKVRGVSRTVREIIKEFQPWTEIRRGRRPEDHYLWALHELNNIDKHRRLHLCSTTLEHVYVFPDPALCGPGALAIHQPRKLKAETEIVRWGTPATIPSEIHVSTDIGLGVAFDEPEVSAVDGRQVADTLGKIASAVHSVGKRLEPEML